MSSSDIAVSVRGLGKSYTIRHNAAKHTMLGDALIERLRRPFQRSTKETFWALKDVSFDIKKGEVVGVIGRNGAGKSTLLKILSRITPPTTGEVDLYGRVGSLLEVGTGFHQELTGRENIFLNGAILGMTRAEIRKQFDAIVDFAGVEQFLDTPVKRYSSGMYVRLAFAVAAHLRSEILIVDEVLAVGDAEFQAKCLGKMKEVSTDGRTVLFVSHNMAAVRTLCSRAIYLSSGQLVLDGVPAQCLALYGGAAAADRPQVWTAFEDRERALCIGRVESRLLGQQPSHSLVIDVELESRTYHRPALVAIDISDAAGVVLMQALPRLEPFIAGRGSRHQSKVRIDLPPLIPGRYTASVWVGSHNNDTLDQVNDCVAFEVSVSPTPGRTFPHTGDHGAIVPTSSVEYRSTGGSEWDHPEPADGFKIAESTTP